MAIKRGSKVDMNSSSASMTDLMFLLLIFLMIATTLINSNSLQLTLPKSTNPTQDKPVVKVSITPSLQYFVDESQVEFSQLEGVLQQRLTGLEDPTIFLYADQSVPVGEVIKVRNIGAANKYKVNLVTSPQ